MRSHFCPDVEPLEDRNPPSLFASDPLSSLFGEKRKPPAPDLAQRQIKVVPSAETGVVLSSLARPAGVSLPDTSHASDWWWADYLYARGGAINPGEASCGDDDQPPQITRYGIDRISEASFLLSGYVRDDTDGELFVYLTGDIYQLAGIRLTASPTGAGDFHFSRHFTLTFPDPGGAVSAQAVDACENYSEIVTDYARPPW